MTAVRCWLFGHDWVPVEASTSELPHKVDWVVTAAVCGRCEDWIGFCDGDCSNKGCPYCD